MTRDQTWTIGKQTCAPRAQPLLKTMEESATGTFFKNNLFVSIKFSFDFFLQLQILPVWLVLTVCIVDYVLFSKSLCNIVRSGLITMQTSL